MRSEAYLCAMLAGALGLLLGVRQPGARLAACACFVLPLLALAWVPVPPPWRGAVCQAGWLGVLALTAALHLPPSSIPTGGRVLPVLLVALGAGCLAGAAMALRQQGSGLQGLPALALIGAASLAFGSRYRGLAKIVSGWLAAIALLNIALACLPLHPGYLPDHLE